MKKICELKPEDLNCNIFSCYDYDGLSLQELLCQFFTKINECIEVSNNALSLMEWLVNEGLSEEVAKQLQKWLEDGTIANIINKTIFGKLNEDVKFNKYFGKGAFTVSTQGFVTAGLKSWKHIQSLTYIGNEQLAVIFPKKKPKIGADPGINNTGSIIVYDRTLKVVKRNDNAKVGHGNDATYNPRTNKIIVASSHNVLYLFNNDAGLTADSIRKFVQYERINGIAYDNESNSYWMYATRQSDQYRYIMKLDENFNIVPGTEQRYTIEGDYCQGIEVYKGFIMFNFTSALTVLNDKYEEKVKYPLYTEPAKKAIGAEQEGLTHIGNGIFATGILTFNSDVIHGDEDLYSDVEAGRIAVFNIKEGFVPNGFGNNFNALAYNQPQNLRRYESLSYCVGIIKNGGSWKFVEGGGSYPYYEPYLKPSGIDLKIKDTGIDLIIESNLDFLASDKQQQRYFIKDSSINPRTQTNPVKYYAGASYWTKDGFHISFNDLKTGERVNPSDVEDDYASYVIRLELLLRTI